MLTNLTTDRSALVALYTATSGVWWKTQEPHYPAKMSENWLSNMSVCKWNGVTCKLGRVHSLQLPDLENCGSCSGTFPSEIGLLGHLEELCASPASEARRTRLTQRHCAGS